MAAKTAMTDKLYACFVCVDDVTDTARFFVEEITGKLQPLDLVGCSDQLACKHCRGKSSRVSSDSTELSRGIAGGCMQHS